LLSYGLSHPRWRAAHLRDGDGQGLRRRDGTEAGAPRHGSARGLGSAARGLALGQAWRTDLASLSDDARPYHRRRHRGDPALVGRRPRRGPARRAEDARGSEALMEFRPSPAQQILISTARAFLRQHCPPEVAQRLALDERGFDETLWRRMAELGW